MTVVQRTSVVSKPGFFGSRASAVKKPASLATEVLKPKATRVSEPATSSSPPDMREQEAIFDTASKVAIGAQTGFALYWSFLKACTIGFATTLMLSSLYYGLVSGESSSLLSEFMGFNLLAAAVAAPAISTALMWPAVFAWRFVDQFGFRRGAHDMIVGGVIGSLWILLELYSMRLPSCLSICFFFGGIAGGFAFWRAQGFPGLTSGEAAAAELLSKKFR